MENYQWIFSLPASIIISVIGMLTHFLNKQIKGETVADITGYFSNHFRSTLVAFIVTVIATIAYWFSVEPNSPKDISNIFLIGYLFDSILNKWDKSTPTV